MCVHDWSHSERNSNEEREALLMVVLLVQLIQNFILTARVHEFSLYLFISEIQFTKSSLSNNIMFITSKIWKVKRMLHACSIHSYYMKDASSTVQP